MTPALVLLDKLAVSHQVLSYEYDDNAPSFGAEAVEKLGLSADCVFKTLVVATDKNTLAVAVVPVTHQMNLKKVAKALSAQGVSTKKAQMADKLRVQSVTGYVLGGVSPIAQKRALPTLIDVSAADLPMMYVSAGRRGLEIGIAPLDLAKITCAHFYDIVD